MKKYFLTGLVVLIPLAITVWVLRTIINTMDQTLLLLPLAYQPKTLLGFDIPGLGTLLTLAIIFLTGVLAANFFGRQLLLAWESLLNRIPVVKSIYSSVKQVSDTLFSSNGQAFRKAVLIQYPHAGSWSIAFQTGVPSEEVAAHLQGDHISVFLPTTPNPTSGFFMMLPKSQVHELNMSVDEALRYIVSMGVVGPDGKLKKNGDQAKITV
jgi:uncharacterized membrane protein